MLDLPCTASFLNEYNSVQGSLFIVHHYLGIKRVKIRIFYQKRLGKQANENYLACSCVGRF